MQRWLGLLLLLLPFSFPAQAQKPVGPLKSEKLKIYECWNTIVRTFVREQIAITLEQGTERPVWLKLQDSLRDPLIAPEHVKSLDRLMWLDELIRDHEEIVHQLKRMRELESR
ncbi:MAG TPA: hypothetical protein VNN73_17405 [Blastocatellia bacterium]|nr:hypothetical protein [Blastocatellia bacterium]